MRKYTMDGAMSVAEQAAFDIENFLNSNPATISVKNVESEVEYQERDIDLIWTFKKGGQKKTVTIEIKGDRYHRTGNYFFETVSNDQKNTPGCFMYTEADYVFYYFIEQRELHILPMPATRKWFINNINDFAERATSTEINGRFAYRTIGRLVNRQRIKKEINNIRIINI